MSDQPSPSGPEQSFADGASDFVIEHYGFPASSVEPARDLRGTPTTAAPPMSSDAARPPVRARRRKIFAASALGLVLAGGIGGVATAATADTGPGPHRGGDRGGVFAVDVRDGAGERTNFDRPGGRR